MGMSARWFSIVAEVAAERALAAATKLHIGLFYTDAEQDLPSEPYIRLRFADCRDLQLDFTAELPLSNDVDAATARDMAAREIDEFRRRAT